MQESKQTQEIKLFTQEEGLSVRTEEVVNFIRNKVEFGEVNAAEVGIFLKKIEKISKTLKEDDTFVALVQSETKKHFEGKTAKMFGMTISERAVSTNWDYAVCGDPIHNSLNMVITQAKELLKAREEQLQKLVDTGVNFGTIKPDHKEVITALPKLIWEDGDGEEVTIKAPIKKQKIGLVYKED